MLSPLSKDVAHTVRCASKRSHILLLHGYMELESPMVDAKCQDQGTSGSEGNDISFAVYRHGGYLGDETKTKSINACPFIRLKISFLS